MIHRRHGAHLDALPLTIAVLLAGASLFTLSLISSEIDAFWAARGAADAWSMAREGLKSIAWASVGTVLVWLGLARRQTWLRGLGAGVLVAAIGRTEASARSVFIVVILAASMLGGLWLPAFLLPSCVRDWSVALPSSWAMPA